MTDQLHFNNLTPHYLLAYLSENMVFLPEHEKTKVKQILHSENMDYHSLQSLVDILSEYSDVFKNTDNEKNRIKM